MRIKVTVIVLNWNGMGDTLACLDSLEGLIPTVFVVDNGSTDGSQEAIARRFPKVRLIETGENLGYAGGNNVGIKRALEEGFDPILILNNDTVVDKGFFEAFLDHFEKEPRAGVLGAKLLKMSQPNMFDHFGGMWDGRSLSFDYVGYGEEDEGQFDQPRELDYVCGAAMMVKREVFKKVGLLDPRFFLFWEEADFCFRAKKAGFKVMSCPSAKIWHRVSASFTGGKPHAGYFLQRNRLLWIEKNLRGKTRASAMVRLLGKELLKHLSEHVVRSLQMLLQRASGTDMTKNKHRLLQSKSALYGTVDYLRRDFYAGRSKNFMNCQ